MINADDHPGASAGAPAPKPDPAATLRSRGYLVLLLIAAVLGVPLAAGAWGFLQAIGQIQKALYTDLPRGLGFHQVPVWWPLPLLAAAGILVAATIRYLPGSAGHEPSGGFAVSGPAAARDLPGILLAALASIGLGAVVGPEAPLIALGGGVAAAAVRLLKPTADRKVVSTAAAAGSFAAVSTLLGSPLLGAFLLMEASGLGGALLDVILLPGLLAAGIGALVFTGLDSWSGLPSSALTIPGLAPAPQPNLAEFGWALAIGVAAAVLGQLIRRGALFLQPYVARHRLLWTPAAGLAVAGLAIAYAEGTGKPQGDVLFSGQSDLGPLISHSAQYTVGALMLLLVYKAAAYGISLSAFRGGPIFPSMFLGAAGGIAMSHLAGMSLVPGIAMGIGALADAMLGLPLTSVLLATLLLGKDGITVMPLVIVAVVVSHVVSARLAARVDGRTDGTDQSPGRGDQPVTPRRDP
jgi:H+/Cl- antiporter ClcA